MDTEKQKQIVVAYYAIKSSLKAILKPIEIELNDPETTMKMSKGAKGNLEWIQSHCEHIKESLTNIENDINDIEHWVDADEEIAGANEMISDILFDVQPVPNKIPNQPALDAIAKMFPPEELKVGKIEFASEKWVRKHAGLSG